MFSNICFQMCLASTIYFLYFVIYIITKINEIMLILVLKTCIESFCIAKAMLCFSTKILANFKYYSTVCKFNETLTNDVVSFEQPDPGI